MNLDELWYKYSVFRENMSIPYTSKMRKNTLPLCLKMNSGAGLRTARVLPEILSVSEVIMARYIKGKYGRVKIQVINYCSWRS